MSKNSGRQCPVADMELKREVSRLKDQRICAPHHLLRQQAVQWFFSRSGSRRRSGGEDFSFTVTGSHRFCTCFLFKPDMGASRRNYPTTKAHISQEHRQKNPQASKKTVRKRHSAKYVQKGKLSGQCGYGELLRTVKIGTAIPADVPIIRRVLPGTDRLS